MTSPILCTEIDLTDGMDLDPMTVCACVTWLAMHHDDYKPEFLAGYMAREMLASPVIVSTSGNPTDPERSA